MLKRLFGKKAAKVEIDINEMSDRFDLYDRKYRADSLVMARVLTAVNKTPIRSDIYGPGRIFYADPDKMLNMKTADLHKSGDQAEEKDLVHASASVSFTDHPHGGSRRGFGLVIRNDSDTFHELFNSVVFGIYGYYDKEDRFEVTKLLVPGPAENGQPARAIEIPVTPENVRGALRFAEICAKALFENAPFSPEQCLSQSQDEDLDKVGVKVTTPAP